MEIRATFRCVRGLAFSMCVDDPYYLAAERTKPTGVVTTLDVNAFATALKRSKELRAAFRKRVAMLTPITGIRRIDDFLTAVREIRIETITEQAGNVVIKEGYEFTPKSKRHIINYRGREWTIRELSRKYGVDYHRVWRLLRRKNAEDVIKELNHERAVRRRRRF